MSFSVKPLVDYLFCSDMREEVRIAREQDMRMKLYQGDQEIARLEEAEQEE